MIEDYVIRKSVKIEGQDISLYFKDKSSGILIPLFDLFQLCDKEKYGIKELKEIAGKDNCKTIQTVADYVIEVCNATGCNNILKETLSNAEEIMALISTFAEQQKSLLPDSFQPGNTNKVRSNKFFTMISVSGHSIRFVQLGEVRWFGLQDVVRFFTPLKACVAEDQISLLDSDCTIIQFPNDETRKCISESGFIQVIKALLPDKAEAKIKELQTAVQESHVKVSEKIQGITDLSIDGDATSVLRYAFVTVKGIKCAVYRHTKRTVIAFFSVHSMAAALNVNPTSYLQRACSKKIKFVTADDVFLTVQGLRSVFYSIAKANTICNNLDIEIKKSDIIEQVIEVTDPREHVVLLNEKCKTEREPDASKAVSSVKMANGQHVIFYGNIRINDTPVLVCFVKSNVNNEAEDAEPWFWSTNIGYAFDIRETTRIAGQSVDEDKKCKVTIPDLKKFNIRMLSLEGVRQTVLHSKRKDDTEDIINTIKEAVNLFIDHNQGQEGIKIQKYEIRSEPVVEEKESKVIEEAKVESEPLTVNGTVTYRNKEVSLKVVMDPAKGVIVFYNLSQLLDSLDIEQDIKDKILENNSDFVSIFDLENVLSDIKDASSVVQELLAQSKAKIQEAMAKFGIPDNRQREEEEAPVDTDKSIRTFIVRAIILAEKYRFILMNLRERGKEVRNLPGPSDQKLLEDLWHYINSTTVDQSAGFGFQRQLIMVSERLKRLETLL